MLRELQRALESRRRRRQALLSATALLPALLPALLAAAVFFRAGTRPDRVRPIVDGGPAVAAPPAWQAPEEGLTRLPLRIIRNRAATCTIVSDRADLVTRCRVDDDELLDFLELAHRPDGLVRIDGSVYLATWIDGAGVPGESLRR